MNQVKKVLDMMSDFNRPQVLGVAALIFIAHREQTSLHYQWEEFGFSDIPDFIVHSIDQLDDDDQFAIAERIAKEFAADDPTVPKVSSFNLSLVAEIPTL